MHDRLTTWNKSSLSLSGTPLILIWDLFVYSVIIFNWRKLVRKLWLTCFADSVASSQSLCRLRADWLRRAISWFIKSTCSRNFHLRNEYLMSSTEFSSSEIVIRLCFLIALPCSLFTFGFVHTYIATYISPHCIHIQYTYELKTKCWSGFIITHLSVNVIHLKHSTLRLTKSRWRCKNTYLVIVR